MLDRTAFTTTTLPPLVEPTEHAIALAFAEHYAERFAYDHTHGAWLRWDDEAGVWRADTVAYVPDCVRSFVRDVRLSHEKPPAGLTRERTWRAIERAARDDRRLAVDHTVWDREPRVLGTPGRTVVLIAEPLPC